MRSDGLARAIAAQKAEYAAFWHAEAQVIDGREIAEALHDMVEHKDCHDRSDPRPLCGS